MKKYPIAAAMLVVAGMAQAQTVGYTRVCSEVTRPDGSTALACKNVPTSPAVVDAAPALPTPSAQPNEASSTASSASTATSGVTTGDTNSVVAVFPPGATTPASPFAQCVLTDSVSGGLVFNAATYAQTKQRPDAVCVLMFLMNMPGTQERRDRLEAKLFKQLGIE